MNHVKGHNESTRVVGQFKRGRTDTIYITYDYGINDILKGDCKLHSRIYSHNKDIPCLDIYYNYYPLLVNEGDLDGNGTTEFGILLDTWNNSSSYRSYRIYTLHNNHWFYIVPPITTSLYLRRSGLELAEPTARKNKIRIRYYNSDSCDYVTIKDTIVSASFVEIDDY